MLPIKIATGLAKAGIVNYLLRGGFFVSLMAATFFIVRKITNMVRRTGAIKNYGDTSTPDGKATAFANQLYQAMISTNAFISKYFGDGTDTAAIYSTAAEMYKNKIPFSEVSKKFRALHGNDLLEMLNSDLSSQEMLRFNQILSAGLAGFTINNLLLTNKPANIYDEFLRPVSTVTPRTRLGTHVESIVHDNGKRYDGIEYKGQMRYVDGENVNWIKIN